MRQKIYELIQQMDIRDINTQLALQCAPVIAGLKPANLLIVQNEQVSSLERIREDISLSFLLLYQSNCKTIILLYNRSYLSCYLAQKQVSAFLKRIGYKNLEFHDILCQFQKRYKAYKANFQEFPHELGLLLGYPLDDVEGFINNKGQNFLYTGYWKVYASLPEKMCLFSEFEKAKESILRQILYSGNMIEIINSNGVDQIK